MMQFQELQSELYCSKCEENELHTLIYLNQHLCKARCEGCGYELFISPDPRKLFYDEFLQRIVTKPERISRELKEDPRRFITLPYRVISKPYRIYKEMQGFRRFISQGQHRNNSKIS